MPLVDDGFIKDGEGRVIHVNIDVFQQALTDENRCPLCMGLLEEPNDEHIFSRWILESCAAFNHKIRIFQEHNQRFDRYVLKLWEKCNRKMGETLETPISRAFLGGYRKLLEFCEKEPQKLYAWLSWIVLKTYLKTRSLRKSLDMRKDDGKIGDEVLWGSLHFIHAFARSIYTSTILDARIFQSMYVIEITDHNDFESLNYFESNYSSVVCIRIHGCAVIAVLGDNGAIDYLLDQRLGGIPNQLTTYQLAELIGEIEITGRRLRGWPRLLNAWDAESESFRLWMEPHGWEKLRLVPLPESEARELIWFHLSPQFEVKGEDEDVVASAHAKVGAGMFAFLESNQRREFFKYERYDGYYRTKFS